MQKIQNELKKLLTLCKNSSLKFTVHGELSVNFLDEENIDIHIPKDKLKAKKEKYITIGKMSSGHDISDIKDEIKVNRKNNNKNIILNVLLIATLLSMLTHRMTASFVVIPFLWFILGLSLGVSKLQFSSHQS